MIFVFGSNLAGRHGAGAAATARVVHGAEYGVGLGITGNAYALPTKDHNIQKLNLVDIKNFVEMFLDFARNNPQHEFQVTRVGCGLAGYTDSDIAPMFYDAPSNCLFDEKWHKYLPRKVEFWGTL